MKERVNLQTLKINGHDPRYSTVFQALSASLNQPNKKLKTISDWEALAQLCYQQLHEYGYDLQTGVWFCFINSQLKGWRGLLQGLELLTGAWRNYGARCWPPENAVALRQSILGWLTQHVATVMYTMPMKTSDLVTIQRVEGEILLLCDHARALEARCTESLENVRYFLQVRAHSLGTTTMSMPQPQILPELCNDETTRHCVANVIPTDLQSTQSRHFRAYIFSGIAGLLLGVTITPVTNGVLEAITSQSWRYVMTTPISLLQRSAQSVAKNNVEFGVQQTQSQKGRVIPEMREQLMWLIATPPHQWVMQGEKLAQRLDKTYPGNVASAEWRQKMQEKVGSLNKINSWSNGMDKLDKLEQRLRMSEKSHNQYMTVSELKTAVYQIKQDFQQQGEPLTEKLNNLQAENLNQQTVNLATMYQIQEKLSVMLAAYTLLKVKTVDTQ